MAKMERKPRRNIQYKDLGKNPLFLTHPLTTRVDPPSANAVSHHDNLEFLEDVIPKTTTYKQVKNQAAATRAKLKGEKTGEAPDGRDDDVEQPNGKRQKSIMNGMGTGSTNGFSRAQVLSDEDPSSQLELEMRQAQRAPGDGDVDMTG